MKIYTSIIFITFNLIFFGCNSSEEKDKQEVKNLILIIGNDSGVNGVKSGDSGNLKKSNLSRASVTALLRTKPVNSSFAEIDPAILAIGKKSINKTLGLDSDGIAHPNLIELASIKGMSTGLITTGLATDVLPASFIVHTIDRTQIESITAEYLNSPIDLFIGGGLHFFTNRSDNTNLIERFKNKGYSVYNNVDDASQSGKLMVITDSNPLKSAQINQDQLLSKYTSLALRSLSGSKNGFFLIIDGCLSKGGIGETKLGRDQNNVMMACNESIGLAFDFADKNPGTLVVVTTDILAFLSAYGTSAKTFEGSYENTEVFDKMVTLLNLPVQ